MQREDFIYLNRNAPHKPHWWPHPFVYLAAIKGHYSPALKNQVSHVGFLVIEHFEIWFHVDRGKVCI